jgi:hypothetical protein
VRRCGRPGANLQVASALAVQAHVFDPAKYGVGFLGQAASPSDDRRVRARTRAIVERSQRAFDHGALDTALDRLMVSVASSEKGSTEAVDRELSLSRLPFWPCRHVRFLHHCSSPVDQPVFARVPGVCKGIKRAISQDRTIDQDECSASLGAELLRNVRSRGPTGMENEGRNRGLDLLRGWGCECLLLAVRPEGENHCGGKCGVAFEEDEQAVSLVDRSRIRICDARRD